MDELKNEADNIKISSVKTTQVKTETLVKTKFLREHQLLRIMLYDLSESQAVKYHVCYVRVYHFPITDPQIKFKIKLVNLF